LLEAQYLIFCQQTALTFSKSLQHSIPDLLGKRFFFFFFFFYFTFIFLFLFFFFFFFLFIFFFLFVSFLFVFFFFFFFFLFFFFYCFFFFFVVLFLFFFFFFFFFFGPTTLGGFWPALRFRSTILYLYTSLSSFSLSSSLNPLLPVQAISVLVFLLVFMNMVPIQLVF